MNTSSIVIRFRLTKAKRDCLGEAGVERLPDEAGFERSEELDALLVTCGQIAPEPAERLSASRGAERAGDLVLDLEHPQVTLRLVLIEGDGQVVEEGEHLLLAQPQALQEILRRRLLAAPTLCGAAWRWRSRGMPGGQQGFLAGNERLAGSAWEVRVTSGAHLLDGCLHRQQDRLAVLGPGLLVAGTTPPGR